MGPPPVPPKRPKFVMPAGSMSNTSQASGSNPSAIPGTTAVPGTPPPPVPPKKSKSPPQDQQPASVSTLPPVVEPRSGTGNDEGSGSGNGGGGGQGKSSNPPPLPPPVSRMYESPMNTFTTTIHTINNSATAVAAAVAAAANAVRQTDVSFMIDTFKRMTVGRLQSLGSSAEADDALANANASASANAGGGGNGPEENGDGNGVDMVRGVWFGLESFVARTVCNGNACNG